MDVLVDLTPLETVTRFHGIGHYIIALGKAIAGLTARERANLDVAGLAALGGDAPTGPLTFTGSEEPRYGWNENFIRRRTELVLTLRRLQPRLFHATHPFGTPRGSFIPRVLTCHDILPLVLHTQYLPGSRVNRELRRALDAQRYRSARRVIAISRHTADDIIRLLSVPARQIDVIPHGVDHDRFRPARGPAEEAADAAARKRLGVDRAPYFLFLGAADPRKKADMLVAAFAAAKLDGVELVFAGRLSPPQKVMIDAAIERAGAGASVRCLGFVTMDDLVPLLRGALALAYPSIYEGFGLPVLEAMASGCPAITTDATALGEVAGDGALIVPPAHEAALTDALRRVVLEPGIRADIRARGFRRAAHFSWRSTAIATIDCYARALAD